MTIVRLNQQKLVCMQAQSLSGFLNLKNMLTYDKGGAVSWLNPTHALFYDVQTRAFERWTNDIKDTHVQLPPDCRIAYKWTSRNNRKGLHSLALSPSTRSFEHLLPPYYKSNSRWIMHNLRRMCTCFPFWDLSFLIAIFSTGGSLAWLINGLIIWMPTSDSASELPGQVTYGGGILAFCAVLLFLGNGCLALLESINEKRSQCFGWQVQEQSSYDNAPVVIIRPGACQHYHAKKDYFVGHETDYQTSYEQSPTSSSLTLAEKISARAQVTCSWLPSWHEFKTHYCRDLGFLAAVTQLAATTVYALSSIPRLPGIYGLLSTTLAEGLLYGPKGVGGCLVAVSATFVMLESQYYWLVPRPQVIGWQIGFWTFAGALGFMVGSWLSFCAEDWASYQSGLSTLWGSACFLIASLLSWYESLAKFPITTEQVGTWAEANRANNENESGA